MEPQAGLPYLLRVQFETEKRPLISELQVRALDRAALYSWDRAAQQTLSLLAPLRSQ